MSNKISAVDLYADDTNIYDIQPDFETLRSNLQKSLRQNGMLLNTGKPKVMIISTRQKKLRLDTSLLSLSYDGIDLQLTTGDKILGVHINENFQNIGKKNATYIWLLSRIKSYLSLQLRSVFYSAYIIVWENSSNYNVSKITKLQKRACNVIIENQYENLESALRTLNILS